MTADQVNDAALRSRIASLIDDGQLPCVLSRDIAAGYGSGRNTCAACGQAIGAREIEYSVKTDQGLLLNFHMRCHTLWQTDCDARRRQGRGP